MGASKKLDPDLDIDHVDDNRVTSGSKAGLHSFKEVPEEEDDDAGFQMSNEEIAAELVLEVSTVKSHLARMLPKLGVRSRLQAVVWAYQNRVVTVPDA